MSTSPSAPISAVVRWLAVTLVSFTFPLLVLGGLTSSSRAGMADPVWPTEPWYIIVNGQMFQESDRGFILEHTHRFAGWVVGGLATATAIAAWLSGPDKKTRILPLVAVVALLALYGWFHGQMMSAWKEHSKVVAALSHGEPPPPLAWPWPAIISTALATAGVLLACVRQLFQPDRAKWVRVAATLVLLGVMIQGLLGGLRVFLDKQTGLKETVGVELSQLHGLFAQVVFSGMFLLPILAGRPKVELADGDRKRVRWAAVAVPVAVLVQLVWAVWVRHGLTTSALGVSQRLHMLTAFVVAGLIVWLVTRVSLTPGVRKPLGLGVHLLAALLLVQVALGVEAWMGKFAATGPEAGLPPTDRKKIFEETGWILMRTGHQMIGALMLATATAVAFRVLRPNNQTSRDRQRAEETEHRSLAVAAG